MSLAKVQTHLEARLKEAADWSQRGFEGTLGTVKIKDRSFDCTVKPVECLKADDGKEPQGVRFRLQWDGNAGKTYTDLDVRIVPEGLKSKKKDATANGPYIAVDVVTTVEKTKKDLIAQLLVTEDSLGTELSIGDFFHRWISRACRNDKSSKIIEYKAAVSA